MLTEEENQLLTQVGPGTPMGSLARHFWIPVMLAEELPTPDCDPVRLDILGEHLIAFRDSAGRIGLLDRWCPHRGTDLFFGRNEHGGIRCIYHGWKFDTGGICLDLPNAPEGVSFKSKVKAQAYPAQERGGMIWGYFGQNDCVPEFPQMEWTNVPDSHRYISKMSLECSYLQSMEADIDSSHLSFLHSTVVDGGVIGGGGLDIRPFTSSDKTPVWDVRDTEYGVMLCARRDANHDSYYWRVNQWMIPFYTMIAAAPSATVLCQVKIPVDDAHCVAFRVRWNVERPLSPEELTTYRDKGVFFPEIIPGTFQTKENRSNDYLIDRSLQRSYSFTGIKSIPAQDFAATERQFGLPVADRTRERLVSSDGAIIQVRRRLLRALTSLQEGTEPIEARNGNVFRVRSLDIVLPADVSLEDGGGPYMVSTAS